MHVSTHVCSLGKKSSWLPLKRKSFQERERDREIERREREERNGFKLWAREREHPLIDETQRQAAQRLKYKIRLSFYHCKNI